MVYPQTIAQYFHIDDNIVTANVVYYNKNLNRYNQKKHAAGSFISGTSPGKHVK